MKKFKLNLIRFADWIDEKVFGHEFYCICQKIACSKSWGDSDEMPKL
jgi:hypothetical protein